MTSKRPLHTEAGIPVIESRFRCNARAYALRSRTTARRLGVRGVLVAGDNQLRREAGRERPGGPIGEER